MEEIDPHTCVWAHTGGLHTGGLHTLVACIHIHLCAHTGGLHPHTCICAHTGGLHTLVACIHIHLWAHTDGLNTFNIKQLHAHSKCDDGGKCGVMVELKLYSHVPSVTCMAFLLNKFF